MSQTFSLACVETKKKIWVGQTSCGGPFRFYSGESDTMQRLRAFLAAHYEKPITLFHDDSEEVEGFKEWCCSEELALGEWPLSET
jgi:hypothetical protein